MTETGNTVKAHRIIIDPVFRDGIPEMHDLFIYAGDEEISCAVADKKERKFIALEVWTLQQTELKTQLAQIRAHSSILSNKNYRKVICCSGFKKSTLVPGPLYDTEMASRHLYFSHPESQGEILHNDEILQLEARNIFAVPSEFSETINSWYMHVELHHTSTAMIDYLLTTNRNKKDEIITVNVHASYMEIIVIKGRTLLLYNFFNYETPEEFVYYILFVCEQLHLNPDHVMLQFAGEIEKSGSLFQLTSRYIRNTSTVTRPEILDYSIEFSRLAPQFQFNLFSQVICAL